MVSHSPTRKTLSAQNPGNSSSGQRMLPLVPSVARQSNSEIAATYGNSGTPRNSAVSDGATGEPETGGTPPPQQSGTETVPSNGNDRMSSQRPPSAPYIPSGSAVPNQQNNPSNATDQNIRRTSFAGEGYWQQDFSCYTDPEAHKSWIGEYKSSDQVGPRGDLYTVVGYQAGGTQQARQRFTPSGSNRKPRERNGNRNPGY